MADQGSYYVPEQSKLPLLAALGMGIMGYGRSIFNNLCCWLSVISYSYVQVVELSNRREYQWYCE